MQRKPRQSRSRGSRHPTVGCAPQGRNWPGDATGCRRLVARPIEVPVGEPNKAKPAAVRGNGESLPPKPEGADGSQGASSGSKSGDRGVGSNAGPPFAFGVYPRRTSSPACLPGEGRGQAAQVFGSARRRPSRHCATGPRPSPGEATYLKGRAPFAFWASEELRRHRFCPKSGRHRQRYSPAGFILSKLSADRLVPAFRAPHRAAAIREGHS